MGHLFNGRKAAYEYGAGSGANGGGYLGNTSTGCGSTGGGSQLVGGSANTCNSKSGNGI